MFHLLQLHSRPDLMARPCCMSYDQGRQIQIRKRMRVGKAPPKSSFTPPSAEPELYQGRDVAQRRNDMR
jgi:hypothetical protein